MENIVTVVSDFHTVRDASGSIIKTGLTLNQYAICSDGSAVFIKSKFVECSVYEYLEQLQNRCKMNNLIEE